MATGNTDWIIIGNSFYQVSSRGAIAAEIQAIFINNTFGNNFNVSGNFIGGSAANAGGTAWKTTGGAAAYLFQGIRLNVGTTTPSTVQGNTIANIFWTSSSNATTLPGVWTGIFVQAGSVNVGTVTGNTIGSGTGGGSISITTSGSGGTSFGIGSGSSGTVALSNNTIGSITVNGSVATASASLTGIAATAGANTISKNTVGSTATPSPLTANLNSLNAITSSTSSTGQQVTGILSTSSASASITGNTVANLNNNYVGTAISGQIRGIVASAGVNTIIGNTVCNLSTTSQNTNTTTAQSVYGIADTSAAAGQTVSQNIVHSLANTVASASVCVSGIYYAGDTGTSLNVIARNLVHSLAVSTSSASSTLTGMFFDAGTFTAQNNMVRVGLQADGTGTAGSSVVLGIFDFYNRKTAGRNFYHNSVYIGGTQTSGAAGSSAAESWGDISPRTFKNNIFTNARTNSGGAGTHYAVVYAGSSAHPPGLVSDGNLFFASGTGGVLGYYDSNVRTSLDTWQTATGQDTLSEVGDPLFLNPTGDASLLDLHLQASNPAEGGGNLVAEVIDDFDGQTRSALTPVDIGADAGNFFAINYPLLTSGSVANRVLTNWLTIKYPVGVASGEIAPCLYFKKSTDADVFGTANDSTGNGWKYVSSTGNGPYSFTLDYALIHGGSVTEGDIIQYFVVAQDATNNLFSNPAFATASAIPPVQNVNGHGSVNSFTIVPTFSGTKTVGSGSEYPNLTGKDGLFGALNSAVLTGDLVVKIKSDLSETGEVTLSEFLTNEYPSSSVYSVTIQPDGPTMRTIAGNVDAGLITLYGADHVTINGGFDSIGRYLTFRNISTGHTASTILFVKDASSNIVRNCVVEGAGTYSGLGVIGFSTGRVTGNDNNLIFGCQVRDLSTAAGVPNTMIGSIGSTDAVANSGNTVSNNELFNFYGGILILPAGNDSWTVTGNNLYNVNAVSGDLYGILIRCGGTNTITHNFIHDLLNRGRSSVGIYFNATNTNSTTTIARNRITAFNVNAATLLVCGIAAQSNYGSTLNVVNNQITLIPTISGNTSLCGINDQCYGGGVINAFYNSVVLGGTEGGVQSSWASLRVNTSSHTARNNLFLNFRTGGPGGHFAASSTGPGGSYTVSHNVYTGTGTPAANFMDFSTGQTSPMSFTTWQSSTGDTNSQAGIAGSGNFTSAMFVNAAAGDLHLVPGGNVLVNALGIPIAGVIDDYDGSLRSATAPTIGSDEYVPNAPPTFSGYTLKAKKNTSLSVGKTKLLSRAADADGGMPAISGVGALSAQGGSLVLGASSIGYSPPVNFTGLDTFGITIIDGQGGSVVGTVTVNVGEGNAAGSGNEPQITLQPGGSVALLFQAIPGQSYRVERSTDLQAWTLLETVTAASDGTLPCVDPDPPVGSAFYRLVVP